MISCSTIGTTRRVLVLGPWAIKVERGACGRRCNKYEANLFRTVDGRRRAMLCPVLWCSGSGVLLVMATAQPLPKADHEDLLYRGDFPDWDYRPGEDDADSDLFRPGIPTRSRPGFRDEAGRLAAVGGVFPAGPRLRHQAPSIIDEGLMPARRELTMRQLR